MAIEGAKVANLALFVPENFRVFRMIAGALSCVWRIKKAGEKSPAFYCS